jgi:hypothetical protein
MEMMAAAAAKAGAEAGAVAAAAETGSKAGAGGAKEGAEGRGEDEGDDSEGEEAALEKMLEAAAAGTIKNDICLVELSAPFHVRFSLRFKLFDLFLLLSALCSLRNLQMQQTKMSRAIIYTRARNSTQTHTNTHTHTHTHAHTHTHTHTQTHTHTYTYKHSRTALMQGSSVMILMRLRAILTPLQHYCKPLVTYLTCREVR